MCVSELERPYQWWTEPKHELACQQRKCSRNLIGALHWVFIFMQKKYFFASELNSPVREPGGSVLVGSSTMKSRKQLVHDVFDTFATHASLAINSLVQTTRHKIAAPTLTFLQPSNVCF